MNNQEITDHSLHLLVDGQLDAASCKKLQQQIDASPQLQQKLKRIIETRELVSLAYLQEKAPAPTPRKPTALFATPAYAAIAASIIMAIGLMLGWAGHQFFQPDQLVVARAIPKGWRWLAIARRK
jgi:anti-sigma factor RsiW